MPRPLGSTLALLPLLGLLGTAGAQELPSGFTTQVVGSSWQSPVGLCYLDQDRLLVAERDGRVWYVENDQKRNLVYDIHAETLTNGDRGMLGIAVPADFDTSGWLYLLLVVDVNGNGNANLGFSRLVRIQTHYEGGDLVADPATREHLLGDVWSTGIPSCHLSHTIGSLHFFSDGSLVLTTGDNAHYDLTDAGGHDPACFNSGRTPIDQDVGAYRSQYDNSLCGKVLRLDPATGRGLPDNPFFTGNPDDLLSRVYARGLRNPFRSTLLPGSGPREALFISDVGWNTWEEVNLALGGENFGWPCFEGEPAQSDYQNADVHGLCTGVDAVHTRPLVAWHHGQGNAGFRGNCATGICMYTGDRYPEIYRGRLFFCDYGRSWMRAAALDGNLAITSTIGFGLSMNGPVELVAQPGTGDLVYIALGTNQILRLVYTGSQLPPHAVASATPAHGPGDLVVQLSAAGSSDPENQALAYAWDLGDGTSSSEPELTHAYAGTDNFLARLTVTDSEGLSDSAEVLITPNNTPPVISSVLTPQDGDTYESDEPMHFQATATDAEDGTPAATWTLDLVHDHHVHPNWASGTGLDVSLTPDSHGHGDNHFIARLTVTDSRGLAVEQSFDIYDRHSHPSAHLVDLPETSVRVGQRLAAVGHVDFSLGRILDKASKLTWDWGDGTVDVHDGVAHQEDVAVTHVYARPGDYKLRLIAELNGAPDEVEADIHVARPWPSVAVFAALEVDRWVSRAQQEAILAALPIALDGHASEVRAFTVGENERLAGWMESLVDDPISDVLVLLDFVPDPLVAPDPRGTLLDRWIAGGNGIVWSGITPLLTTLDDSGTAAVRTSGVDEFFGAPGTNIAFGAGHQTPTATGARILPSLSPYDSDRALRYDRLGPQWSVGRVFAEDGDQDAGDLEILQAGGGFYAQFLCDQAADLPRAAVLSEYLLDKVGRGRLGSGPIPARKP